MGATISKSLLFLGLMYIVMLSGTFYFANQKSYVSVLFIFGILLCLIYLITFSLNYETEKKRYGDFIKVKEKLARDKRIYETVISQLKEDEKNSNNDKERQLIREEIRFIEEKYNQDFMNNYEMYKIALTNYYNSYNSKNVTISESKGKYKTISGVEEEIIPIAEENGKVANLLPSDPAFTVYDEYEETQ